MRERSDQGKIKGRALIIWKVRYGERREKGKGKKEKDRKERKEEGERGGGGGG